MKTVEIKTAVRTNLDLLGNEVIPGMEVVVLPLAGKTILTLSAWKKGMEYLTLSARSVKEVETGVWEVSGLEFQTCEGRQLFQWAMKSADSYGEDNFVRVVLHGNLSGLQKALDGNGCKRNAVFTVSHEGMEMKTTLAEVEAVGGFQNWATLNGFKMYGMNKPYKKHKK